MMLDVTKGDSQRRLLELELEAVGIRLNTKAPDVIIRQKMAGGVTINATVPLTRIDDKAIRLALSAYKIHNADVMIREDINIDEFYDVLLGTRKYLPCLYCYNKIDAISLEGTSTISIHCERF